MPYKEIWVSPEVAFVHTMGEISIPVYHSYKDNNVENQLADWYKLHPDNDADAFDVRGLDGGSNDCDHELIIKRAIEMGDLDRYMPEDLLSRVQAIRRGEEPDPFPEGCCQSCGNDEFYAHQVCTIEVRVSKNILKHLPIPSLENTGTVINSMPPFGPYTCTVCGREYDNLPNGSGT